MDMLWLVWVFILFVVFMSCLHFLQEIASCRVEKFFSEPDERRGNSDAMIFIHSRYVSLLILGNESSFKIVEKISRIELYPSPTLQTQWGEGQPGVYTPRIEKWKVRLHKWFILDYLRRHNFSQLRLEKIHAVLR
jgi:hypothetical protein